MIYFVIEDPSGKYRPGTKLDGLVARQAHLAGVALIPIDLNMYQVGSAVSGFFKLDCGEGIALPPTARPILPLSLCVRPQVSTIHWRACLQSDDVSQNWGQIRLTTDTSQYGAVVGINSDAVTLSDYKKPGVFVVGGQSLIPAPMGGMMGFALWGTGGVKVLWAAISQTARSTGDTTMITEHSQGGQPVVIPQTERGYAVPGK